MQRSMIVVLFIISFGFLSDCANSWSKGRKKRYGIPVYQGPWSQNKPKDIYSQHNNRIKQQKHAQHNKYVQQPKPKHRRRG